MATRGHGVGDVHSGRREEKEEEHADEEKKKLNRTNRF
jgi:hypothetical protein